MNRRSKTVLMVVTLVLLLALAVGSVAPGLSTRVPGLHMAPHAGGGSGTQNMMEDGLHMHMAPHAGGSSGT